MSKSIRALRVALLHRLYTKGTEAATAYVLSLRIHTAATSVLQGNTSAKGLHMQRQYTLVSVGAVKEV
jgi:hypothetical protein